jgi:ferredoxin-NADP reductase
MVLAFLGVGFIVFTFEDWRFGADALTSYERYWLAGPSLFLAFFMLTEPFTTPPTKRLQVAYGALVAVLANVAFLAPVVKMTPELALVIGNIAFWPSTLRRKLVLPLQSVRQLADQTYEYIFTKPSGLRFLPGQYLEWMLPHARPDSRGVRRYFTIASSPTEPVVRLALRTVPTGGSSYKAKLAMLQPGETIVASQLAGDFLLPSDPAAKLGFIAGGIGITPFRSHIQYMADTGVAHDTVLFYCNNTRADIAYADEFAAAATVMPLSIVHVIAKEDVAEPFETGFIDAAMLQRRAPDYRERTWYLSGPPGMVNAYETMLQKAGVPAARIIKDFFPGLA